MRAALVLLLLGGCGANATSADGGADASMPVVLPLGTASAASASCPVAAAPGAVCQTLTVHCPGLDDLAATIAVTQPPGAPTGTVVLLGGAGGTVPFNSGFPGAYLQKGLRVVQISWAAAWQESTVGMKAAACRPATALKWVFDQAHKSDRTRGFCVQGHSAGAGTVAYALAHYGLEDVLDFALISAGPPYGRIDYGCAPSAYTGAPPDVCPELPAAGFSYSGSRVAVDLWENTSTCGEPSPPDADVARWAADSVVSPGADFDHPSTPVSAWFCANKPNETPGLGTFWLSQLTSMKTVTCVSDQCTGEAVFANPTALTDMVSAMTQGCVPRHGP
jgi:hypothetical protein